MEAQPQEPAQTTRPGEPSDCRPVEDGVVSPSQQVQAEQAPHPEVPPETAQAVGRLSTEHAGVKGNGMTEPVYVGPDGAEEYAEADTQVVDLDVTDEDRKPPLGKPSTPELDEAIAQRIIKEVTEARKMGFGGPYMEGVIRRTVSRRLRGYAGTLDIMKENGLYGKP